MMPILRVRETGNSRIASPRLAPLAFRSTAVFVIKPSLLQLLWTGHEVPLLQLLWTGGSRPTGRQQISLASHHFRWAKALLASVIFWVFFLRLAAAPAPLEASISSPERRSAMVRSRRAREYITSQRSARVVERPCLTSIGTWWGAPRRSRVGVRRRGG